MKNLTLGMLWNAKTEWKNTTIAAVTTSAKTTSVIVRVMAAAGIAHAKVTTVHGDDMGSAPQTRWKHTVLGMIKATAFKMEY